jgi:hypothetical protein
MRQWQINVIICVRYRAIWTLNTKCILWSLLEQLNDAWVSFHIFLNCDIEAFLFISAVMLGQDTKQRAKFKPPLGFWYAVPEMYIS